MTALNILLGVAAFVCLIFIVGEPKPPNITKNQREGSGPPSTSIRRTTPCNIDRKS